jgi:antitoxin YefM
MLDSVSAEHPPLLLTHDSGKLPAVLISAENCASTEERMRILSRPRNPARLLEAIADLDAGEGFASELID